MQKEEVVKESLAVIANSEIAMVGTNGNEGYPNIKAMLKMENEGLHTLWFSTNVSSRRVGQLKKNPKACVYFIDNAQWKGLMLVGNMEVLTDKASRQRLWRTGFEKYYPQGIDDPDYCVLRFSTIWGNYYHGLENLTFEL